LFYDLVVVVLVGQAAHHLADHLTWAGLGEFVAVFTLIWIAWFNGTLLHDSTSWARGSADARVFRRCSRRWFRRWFMDASISSA
jgi:Bacterial low temperature requirement A protein (LtrA)